MQRHKLMRHVVPGSMHVVLAGREDGVVGMVYTRAPVDWLLTIAESFKIAHSEIRASAAAPRIVVAWRSRFPIEPQPGSLLPWFRVQFVDAVRALDDYNLVTGALHNGFDLNAPVRVRSLNARGKVIGYSAGHERIAVRLDRGNITSNVCMAPASDLELALATTTDRAGQT
jgi:hypothetical protein